MRFHACFSAFWNLTGKANKTDPIRPFLPAIGLEGAHAACAPRLDPPMDGKDDDDDDDDVLIGSGGRFNSDC